MFCHTSIHLGDTGEYIQAFVAIVATLVVAYYAKKANGIQMAQVEFNRQIEHDRIGQTLIVEYYWKQGRRGNIRFVRLTNTGPYELSANARHHYDEPDRDETLRLFDQVIIPDGSKTFDLASDNEVMPRYLTIGFSLSDRTCPCGQPDGKYGHWTKHMSIPQERGTEVETYNPTIHGEAEWEKLISLVPAVEKYKNSNIFMILYYLALPNSQGKRRWVAFCHTYGGIGPVEGPIVGIEES